MPKLVILNHGPDTAGCGIGLKRAFDKHAPGWEARAICRQSIWLQYPTDIVWPMSPTKALTRQVMDLVASADVIHVMDNERALYPFRHLIRRKVVVVHHLGTHYRRNPAQVSANCRAFRATEVTDSIDLLRPPQIGWLPVTADLDALAATRRMRYRRSSRIRIAHAPTNRAIKSTEVIRATVNNLAQRYPIGFDLIEGVSNYRCLQRKATADIFVDQLTLGFGMNAIECWAMGIPVVSGLLDPEARARALEMWDGFLPWMDATPGTLEEVIEQLIVDRERREGLGVIGRLHADRWHSQRAVVEQTLAVYERAGVQVAA